MYALSTNFSTKKSNFVAAYKPYLSSKVIISHPNERANISFITEIVTSSRYAESSASIQEVRLNSENTSVVTSTKSGSNLYSDLTISIKNPFDVISLLKDIKSGNNMHKVTSGVIGEIPYNSPTELYSILNEPKDLIELSKLRIDILKNNQLDDTEKKMLKPYLKNIEALDSIRDQSHIQYNLLLQEELYKALSIPGIRRINMSYYYGVLVKEYETNPEFFRRLQPHINNRIFDNKKNINAFLAKAAIIYHETINPIISNMEATRGNTWEVTFLDDIKDDIFT
jgi:hypothetical protein